MDRCNLPLNKMMDKYNLSSEEIEEVNKVSSKARYFLIKKIKQSYKEANSVAAKGNLLKDLISILENTNTDYFHKKDVVNLKKLDSDYVKAFHTVKECKRKIVEDSYYGMLTNELKKKIEIETSLSINDILSLISFRQLILNYLSDN